jgi:hypothetical protein
MKTAHFSSAREAKEFLVAQIVEEAQREGVALSEVERKMLYFTESGWTLPDMMDVNDKFDEEYDQAEYEAKIAKLIKHAVKRTAKENSEEHERWLAAVKKLSREDHYVLVMAQMGGLGSPRATSDRVSGLYVWVILVILFSAFGAMKYLGYSGSRSELTLVQSYNLRADRIYGFIWFAVAVLTCVYMVLPTAARVAVNRQLSRTLGIFSRRKRKQ